MTELRARRRPSFLVLVVLSVVLVAVLAWAVLEPNLRTVTPLPSGDPANGVTIINGIGSATVTIVYERPDGGTEKLADLGPGQQAVVDTIFAEREGLCRTGRLVALTAEGAELDELYLVCRGRSWTVEAP